MSAERNILWCSLEANNGGDSIEYPPQMFFAEMQEKYGLGATLNPFKPNGISHCYQLEQPISNFGGVGGIFLSNFNSRFYKQIVKFLIRHRIIRYLIGICIVCLCLIIETSGLYGLRVINVSSFLHSCSLLEASGGFLPNFTIQKV